MSDNTLISVCLPVYNEETRIGKAIQSVLDQSHVNFELIIVDNCSTDRTYEVARQFSDPRIRFFQNEENLGFRLNSNIALSHVQGNYIATIHGDDSYIRNDYLSKVIGVFKENPNVGIVQFIAEEHKRNYFKKTIMKSIDYYSFVVGSPVTPPPTVTSFRTTAIQDTEYYACDYWSCEQRFFQAIAAKGFDAYFKRNEGFFERYNGAEKDSAQLGNLIMLYEHKYNYYSEVKDDKKVKKEDLNLLVNRLNDNFSLIENIFKANTQIEALKEAYESAIEKHTKLKLNK